MSITGHWQEADGTVLEFVKVNAADGGWYYEARLVSVSDRLQAYGFEAGQSKELTLVSVAADMWAGVGIVRNAQGAISGYQFRRYVVDGDQLHVTTFVGESGQSPGDERTLTRLAGPSG